MKLLKLFSICFLLSFSVLMLCGQQADLSVPIVTTGIGSTEREAIDDALLVAVKRVCKIYTSEVRVLNDDDIVTNVQTMITQGTIQQHKVLNSVVQDGKVYVTVSAVVSGPKLVAYVQSKGNTVSFGGATFGMNMKLKEMNKQNEILEVEQMLNRLDNIHNFFNFELSLGNLSVYTNDPNFYECEGVVSAITNTNVKLYNDLIFNTLSALNLTKEERLEYDGLNINVYTLTIGDHDYFLRQNHTTMLKNENISKAFNASLNLFVIRDNLNDELTTLHSGDLEDNGQIFYNESVTRRMRPQIHWKDWKIQCYAPRIHEAGLRYATRSFRLLIPISDIHLYSQFNVEPIIEKSSVNKARGIYVGENRYVGDLVDGKPNGKGIMYFSSFSDTLTIDGSWKNGYANGSNIVLRFKDGRVYEGQMVNGKIEGQGKLYHIKNDFFLHRWKSIRAANVNMPDYRYYNLSDRGYYIGHFKNGEIDGYGTIYYLSGKIRYQGSFKDGMRHGQGKHFYENGDTYEGKWAFGVFKEGTYTMRDGINDDMYNGNYHDHYKLKEFEEAFGCTKIWRYTVERENNGFSYAFRKSSGQDQYCLVLAPGEEIFYVNTSFYPYRLREGEELVDWGSGVVPNSETGKVEKIFYNKVKTFSLGPIRPSQM